MILLLLIAQPALQLELVQSDASCPDAIAFREMVAQSAPLGEGPLVLSVRVQLEGPPWRATVKSASGERQIEGESCAAVAAAASVIVALQLDALPPPPPPLPDRPPPPPPPARPRAVLRPVERGEEPAGEERLIPWIGAATGVAIGPLPDPTLEIGLSAGVLFGLLRAELSARHLVETTVSQGVAGARFSLFAGAARVCLLGRLPAAELFGCAVAELGVLLARGFGVSDPAREDPLWLSLGAAAGAAIPLVGPLRLVPALRAEIPLSRPHFALGGREIHRPERWSLGASLGLEVRFR